LTADVYGRYRFFCGRIQRIASAIVRVIHLIVKHWRVKRLGRGRYDWAAVSSGGKVDLYDQRGSRICAISYRSTLRAVIALRRKGYRRLGPREVSSLRALDSRKSRRRQQDDSPRHRRNRYAKRSDSR